MTVDRKGGGWVFPVFEPLRAGQASSARWPAEICREQLTFVGVRAEQRLQRRALRARSARSAFVSQSAHTLLLSYCRFASNVAFSVRQLQYSRCFLPLCLLTSLGGGAFDSLWPLLLRARSGYSGVKQISHHTYPTLDKSP